MRQQSESRTLITEAIPEIEAHGKPLPCGIDYEANIYFRQEHQGLLLGTYEPTSTELQL